MKYSEGDAGEMATPVRGWIKGKRKRGATGSAQERR
jgi:hypothetical protein